MEERLRYLFGRYQANTCSEKELEEFFSLIQRSPDDKDLRELIRKLYGEIKDNSSLSTYVDERGRLIANEPEWLPELKEVKTRRSGAYAPVLAIVLMIMMVGAIWLIKSKNNKTGKTSAVASLTKKTTDRSEYKFILLEDSTQVWLNAASSLEFPDHFNATRREVYLSGEAYFDVKHADKLPFIIHSGDVSTTVLGTAFNIKAYPGGKNVVISVSRGKVSVANKNGWVATLVKGQQVKIESQGKEIAQRNIAVSEVATWQQGNISYDDETIEDIVADMQRVYNANIQVTDQSLMDQRVSTSFKREIGAEQALQVLCKLTDKELKIQDGVYVIQ